MVLSLDDNLFPANSFKDVIFDRRQGIDEQALSKESVMYLIVFMRFAFMRVPEVWWRPVLVLTLDHLRNAYYILSICIKAYMLDVACSIAIALRMFCAVCAKRIFGLVPFFHVCV